MSRSSNSKLALVCTPDLRQGGGVTNYYRTLRLDEGADIDYFAVNRDGTSSLVTKAWHVVLIAWSFARRVRLYSLAHLNPSLNRNSYYRDMLLVSLARLCGAKTLVFFRGWDERFEAKVRSSAFQRALFRHTYARATAFVVLGEYFERRLRGLGVAHTTPIHIETTVASAEGVERLDLEAKLASADEGFRVLFLSRVLKEKGIYIAIDAFSICRRERPARAMSLHIAGSGPELEAARAYVAEKGLAGIVFEGDVTGARKAELLRSCHVMLFPTFYGEGLPNSILEGMLFGLAIVTRPVAAIPEVVRHEVNGLLSDSLDARQFADALGKLVQDRQMLRGMAMTNSEIAGQRFTADVVRQRLRSIYVQTVAGSCAA